MVKKVKIILVSFITFLLSIPFLPSQSILSASETIEIYPQIEETDRITSISISSNGRHLVTSGYDRTIRLWDITSGREVRKFLGHQSTVAAVRFSKDGKFIVSGSADKTIRIWEVSSGKELRRFTYSWHIASYTPNKTWLEQNMSAPDLMYVAFSPDGKYVMATIRDFCHLRLYDVEKGEMADSQIHAQCFFGFSVPLAFSPDGKYVLTGQVGADLRLFEIPSGKSIRRYHGILKGHSNAVRSVSFSPDGKYAVSGSDDETLRLWDVATGEMIRKFKGHKDSVRVALFSPDGKYIVSGSEDKTVRLWDVATGKETKTIIQTPYKISFIALTPDGRFVAYAGMDGQAGLTEIASGREIIRFFAFKSGDWLVLNPEGYYNASENGDRYLITKVGGNVYSMQQYRETLFRPELVKLALSSLSSPAPSSAIPYLAKSDKQRLAEEKRLAEQRRLEEECRLAELNKKEEERRLAEERRIKEEEQRLAEQRRLEQERRIAEQKRLDEEKRLAEQRKLKEEQRRLAEEKRRAEEERRLAEERRIKEEEQRLAEQRRLEQERRIAEQKRLDEEKRLAEQRRLEDERRLAEQKRLQEEALPKVPKLAKIADIKVPPEVSIVSTPASTEKDEVTLTLKIENRGGGIGDIRIYLNGTAILLENARGLAIVGVKDKTMYKSYRIKLLNGENTIRAVAFNEDNTMSSADAMHKIIATLNVIKRPSLYALIIGIQEFKNPRLELKYALADADLFANTIKTGASGLFDKVTIKRLTSREETTREHISHELRSLRALTSPDDMFVLYVASHGTIDEGEYFLITSNVGSTSTASLKRDALSQTVLKELISNIPATKKLVIVDTCNAGALGEAMQVALLTRGMSEDTAIKILGRAVGSTILSASTSLQEALEGYQGHGLFTYVVAEGMRGKADRVKSGFVRTTDLADYVDNEVPLLAEKVYRRAQYPIISISGMAFPIAKVGER
jgi:WD40 repeat protein